MKLGGKLSHSLFLLNILCKMRAAGGERSEGAESSLLPAPCRAVSPAASHMWGQRAARGPSNIAGVWQKSLWKHREATAVIITSVIILRYPYLETSCLLHSKGKRSTHCSNRQAKYPGPAESQFCKCYFQSSLTSWRVLSTSSDCLPLPLREAGVLSSSLIALCYVKRGRPAGSNKENKNLK